MVPDTAPLDGLWVLLVENQGRLPTDGIDGRVPMMAKTGKDEHFVLGFRNMTLAQQFISKSQVSAEPRMVVKSNHSTYKKVAQEAGALGVLIDFDPATKRYGSAAEL